MCIFAETGSWNKICKYRGTCSSECVGANGTECCEELDWPSEWGNFAPLDPSYWWRLEQAADAVCEYDNGNEGEKQLLTEAFNILLHAYLGEGGEDPGFEGFSYNLRYTWYTYASSGKLTD